MTDPFSTTIEVPLEGPVDLERALREVPHGYTMKGMFFERQRTALGDVWPALRKTLTQPPERTYGAFESYPMTDYLKLFVRVAEDRFGKTSSREGVRLLARGEVEVFASSTLGKVTFAMLREPGSALLRYPDVSGVLARGPNITSKRTNDRTVQVTYARYHGVVEYAIGAVEGLVLAFEEQPSLQVDIQPNGDLTLDVSW